MLNVGNANKPVYLPVELCTLARGQRQLKLSPSQSASMIRETAVPPSTRSQRIVSAVRDQAKLATDPVARGFGLQVSTEMLSVSIAFPLASI